MPLDGRQPDHPRTPELVRGASYKAFDSQFKAWRRQLHLWEPSFLEAGSEFRAALRAAAAAPVADGNEPAPSPLSGLDFLQEYISEDEDEDVAMTAGGPQEGRTVATAAAAEDDGGEGAGEEGGDGPPCERNPTCVRGFKHGGRGGHCSIRGQPGRRKRQQQKLLDSRLLEEDEVRQSELSAEESINQGVEDDGVESESSDSDDCAREPTALAAPADGATFDTWLSRHVGQHVSPPRPSDTDAGGGLSFTNEPTAPLLAPPPLAAHPNATEEQLREMIKDREDVSRALMLEFRASEDGRLAAEAAWSRAEAELLRWQRGELRLVPEVTDVETGQVSSTVVTETDERRRGLKRSCEPGALAHMIETSQKTVKIKQEVVEQRAAAADAKERLEDQLACVVCMAQPRSVVMRPCNHYVCCSVCASQQTHCPSAGCSMLVTSRLQDICMAPHQQVFEMGTGPPESEHKE